MVMQVLRAKAGDTLAWNSSRTDAAGDPVDLSGVTIANSFTSGSGTIAPSVTVLDAAAGVFEIVATAEVTAGWTPGVYLGDVTFTDGLGAQSTETFAITVERGYP